MNADLPICPRCLTGYDTDGDGNCPVCAHWSPERAREQRDWVTITLKERE